MAIQFARIEIVGRSSGGKACCKAAYNARTIIKDQKTNITYNFSNRDDNVYHEVLLPEGVDQRFKSISELMNAVEHIERKDNSTYINRGSGNSNRNKIRYPKKCRKTAWKRFYKLFPHLAKENEKITN